MRLAMIQFVTDQACGILQPVIMAQMDGSLLDDLFETQVLENVAPPTYGHQKRAEAAFHWFKKNRLVEFKEQVTYIICDCGNSINHEDPKAWYFVDAAYSLSMLTVDLDITGTARSICIAATYLLMDELTSRYNYGKHLESFVEIEDLSHGVPIVAWSMVEALQLSREPSDQKVCLQVLRSLAELNPEHASAWLATGLLHTLTESETSGDRKSSNELRGELRQLSDAKPNDKNVRKGFVA